MEHLVEKMKTTVKRGLILRFVKINIRSKISAHHGFLTEFSTFVSEMRNAMQTTPQTLSSTCTQRKARACSTAGRMCLDICSRYRRQLHPDLLLVRSICRTFNKILSH